MQRKNLKTGVIYATRTSSTLGRPNAVIIVDLSELWTTGKFRSRPRPYVYQDAKPGMTSYGDETLGYRAYTTYALRKDSLDDPRLTAQNWAAYQARDKPEDLDYVTARIITPRELAGEWDTVLADRGVKAAAEKQRRAAVEAEAKRKIAPAVELVAQLRALGVPGDLPEPRVGYYDSRAERCSTHGAYELSLTLKQVEHLLSLIPDA